ncbi:MAG: Tm-1-like ATP-binding domain-containing protein, partial [Bacteroidetes bacterium]|nr:Tm-1-like ATP-binding domain-containing protein [Bacteroidota bacterium]
MKTIAILATLDTKAAEAGFMKAEIERLGGKGIVIDIGVVGTPGMEAHFTRRDVIAAGGSTLEEQLDHPSRAKSNPIVTAGATKIMLALQQEGRIHGAVALGGTQGTSTCAPILQALPYGFPKVMLSTAAAGNTAPFVGIKDITMMFAVSDILGLNVFSRHILANAAAAAWGMAQVDHSVTRSNAKGVIGMTNLGVLTKGAMLAIELFESRGYEVITFHAIGAGGEAMEQMMKEGIIQGVFDYAMGEIADGVFGVLRASGPERLTVAGKLGLPQVICPGGSEHLGILVQHPNEAPDGWEDHQIVWHSPYVFVPRLNAEEQDRVAAEIGKRLQHT